MKTSTMNKLRRHKFAVICVLIAVAFALAVEPQKAAALIRKHQAALAENKVVGQLYSLVNAGSVTGKNWRTASEAQNTPVKSAGAGGTAPAPNNPAAVLYDQNNNASGNGAPDQDFEAAFDTYDSEGADDFVVPVGRVWTVQTVVQASTTGVAANQTGDIVFYANSGSNFPGSAVCTKNGETSVVTAGSTTTNLSGGGCVLPAGTYWVGIQINQSFGSFGQHFWSNRSVQSNSGGAWRNPGNGFATGCTSFGRQTTCGVGGGVSPDFLFRLEGLDNPACAITCPANQVAWTAGASAVVNYPAPTADVSCGTVTCSPPSGSSFNVGTTAVNCSTTAGPTCSFNVTVRQLALSQTGMTPGEVPCFGPGEKSNLTFTLTNNSAVSATVSGTANLTNLVYVVGSASASAAGTVSATSDSVSWSGTLAAGASVTVSYMVQFSDTAPPQSLACATLTATANSQPVQGQSRICAQLNCQAKGPGLPVPSSSEASDQKAGSLLVYNVYTSSTDPTRQNTRINITNADPSRPVFVHLFFVSEGCAVADSYICLTANQTASFLASDLDPGVTGYLVAVAVDARGCPVSRNCLIGDEYVKFAAGHAANLGAVAFSQLAGGLPVCDGNSVTATLSFDGVSYNRTPAVLALDNVGSRADGNDTLVVINRIGGNLGIGAASLGTLFGIFYDDAENALSFSVTGGCQLRSSITNNFPRLTPRFETFIPAGRTGWARIYNQTGAIGMTGAAINFNANAASSAGAFNQGHNLHHLTLNAGMSYVIPVFPPSC